MERGAYKAGRIGTWAHKTEEPWWSPVVIGLPFLLSLHLTLAFPPFVYSELTPLLPLQLTGRTPAPVQCLWGLWAPSRLAVSLENMSLDGLDWVTYLLFVQMLL